MKEPEKIMEILWKLATNDFSTRKVKHLTTVQNSIRSFKYNLSPVRPQIEVQMQQCISGKISEQLKIVCN
jgi:hypothetical protein